MYRQYDKLGIEMLGARKTVRFRFQETFFLQYIRFSCFLTVFITLAIFVILGSHTIDFFHRVSILDFFFGLHWSPQTAMRQGQVGASGAFGLIPLLTGTLLITLIALVISAPLGIGSALLTSQYLTEKQRQLVKPFFEILAGIPVYGRCSLASWDVFHSLPFVIQSAGGIVMVYDNSFSSWS